MTVIDLVLALCAIPALLASLYLATLALLARKPSVARAAAGVRFDIVVPAHDEEAGIGDTVASLLAVDYTRERFRVFVVADNCQDATAERAAAAGAAVLVRTDLEHRGKGYALARAFSHSLNDGWADAVVVVDADTLVSKNLLSAFAARFANGAAVLQADYGVRNVHSSWRTRVMTIALAAFHGVRSSARERLRLSCGLRGNGMAFSADVLRRQPPNAFSIVEDLEYGLQLGYAGIRVQYVEDAHVWGHMAVSDGDSRSQRRRWERGRKALVRQHVRRLLAEAWRRKDACLADLAVDLIVPPLGQLVAVTVLGLVISLAMLPLGARLAPAVWLIATMSIVGYVARGVAYSGFGFAGALDLLWVPAYIVWKLSLRFSDKGQKPAEWVRTAREVRS